MTGRTLLSATARRSRGVYYTPGDLAAWMTSWSITPHTQRVLEPSFGDGSFLRGLRDAKTSGADDIAVLGIEIDEATRRSAITDGLIGDSDSICADFLEVEPTPVDAVIGNPPFVRLRHLTKRQSTAALDRAREALGRDMEPSGSLWMPFLLHSTKFLTAGGRVALVLPFEITHVRYARGLWTWLGQRFGSIRLVRLHERVFDNILQDVVLLLCADYGCETSDIEFAAYYTLDDFFEGRHVTEEKISIIAADSGSKPFTKALLTEELRNLVYGELPEILVPLAELATFSIGYVSGDKDFFHPAPEIIERFGLHESENLIRSITRTRDLQNSGLYTSDLLQRGHDTRLFLLAKEAIPSPGEATYIAAGRKAGVADKYKCRVRSPWWSVPGVMYPDLILSVFSSTPRLVLNDGALAASNSLLCGRLTPGVDGSSVIAAWYTSLTLLECETNVHALGGGVMVLIPGEVARIRVPRLSCNTQTNYLYELDSTLRAKGLLDAYRLGDHRVLQQGLNLSSQQVELIREGVTTLARWREKPK
ncbi:MAG TPA: N-6 DNA methylase [Pseudonocardiaceae bacterium]|nr:N-6 DNA methylase [Pseudonocardiaceae bacterium]